MIVEYIRYKLNPEQFSAFEDAYTKAQPFLQQSVHFLGYEMCRSLDEPGRYIIRIHWNSVMGHLEGFRKSAAFAGFYELVKPFFSCIEEMKHYEILLSKLNIAPRSL